jgi:predicted amidohydrolase YtcJ
MRDGQQSGVRRLPYQSLLRMGFRPPGNSDTAGTRTESINPMANIHLLVTRTNSRGVAVQPEEALSVTDALRVYTLFAAYSSFEERLKGRSSQASWRTWSSFPPTFYRFRRHG